MRCIACAILSMFFALPVCAADRTWSVDTTEAKTVMDGFDQQVDVLALSVDEITEKLRAIDPGFVRFFESSALIQEDKKANVLRSYLAYKSYEYYKNKYLADLKQRSRETGREIKSKHFESGVIKDSYYWLDRGRLDEPECHLNGDVNDFGTCQYPDGFEDFTIVITTYQPSDNTVQNQVTNFINELSGNSGIKTYRIGIERDIPHQNVNLAIIVLLDNQGNAIKNDSENSYEQFIDNQFSASVSIITSRYDEMHEWRNQEAADTLAGKHDVWYTEETSRGTLIHEQQEKDMSAWKSNLVPGAHVFSHSISRIDSTQRYKTK